MNDTLDESRYHCVWIHFQCLGASYSGRGVLTWNPAAGFNIEAPVERLGPPLHGTIEFGAPIQPTEFGTIRIGLGRGWYAVSPRVYLGARMDVLLQSHLSVNIERMTFIQRVGTPREGARWYGSAELRCADTIFLPEEFRRETYVAGERIHTSFRRGALMFKDANQELRCWSPDSHTLKLEWSLDTREWSFYYSWQFAEALTAAASILTGQALALVERIGKRRDREYCERSKRARKHTDSGSWLHSECRRR